MTTFLKNIYFDKKRLLENAIGESARLYRLCSIDNPNRDPFQNLMYTQYYEDYLLSIIEVKTLTQTCENLVETLSNYSAEQDSQKKYIALTIGCNDNEPKDLFKRFVDFIQSAYCKNGKATYFFEKSSHLHIHALLSVPLHNTAINKHSDIRKRYGVQKNGVKTNFDIRLLKTRLDCLKWSNYIQKADTKEEVEEILADTDIQGMGEIANLKTII